MYHNIHTSSKLMIIGWIIHSIAVNFFDILWWISFEKTISWGILVPIILNHCIHINVLVDLLFTFLLWFVQYLLYYVCMCVCVRVRSRACVHVWLCKLIKYNCT